jgi:Trypsin-co-occurring domain 1
LVVQLAKYMADDSTEVSFEIERIEGFQPAGLDEVVGRVRDAVAPALLAAREVLERVKQLSPAEVQVTFGVKATGTMNWVVARAASEGSFQVTLSWKPAPQTTWAGTPGPSESSGSPVPS